MREVRKIRVLIADDHALVRSGLRSILETESEIEVVRERLVAVAGLAHDLDLRLALENRAQAASYERVIVGDQNANLPDFPHRPKSLPRKLAFSVRSRSSIAPRGSLSST